MTPHRFRRPIVLGALSGVAVAVVIAAFLPSPGRTDAPYGVVLSECDGALRRLVIQYEPGAKAISLPVFREFLPQLPADVTVHVVCPDDAAWRELADAVGPTDCTLTPRIVGHAMTTWSRDRWVCLRDTAGWAVLLHGAAEAGAELWPAREGDQRIAADLAASLPRVLEHRTGLLFDGGDVMADSRNALIVGRVLARNVGKTVESPEDFRLRMGRLLGRPVTILDAPDHHAAMFMMSAGDNVMLVGDVRLARAMLTGHARLAREMPVEQLLPGGVDDSDTMQQSLDGLAEQCRQLGYEVVRMPLLPSRDGRVFVTYLNAILDARDGRRIVYMPVYRHADPLNAAATAVWQSLGYEVRPIDCTSAYRHFGCLHCLVNVLERSITVGRFSPPG